MTERLFEVRLMVASGACLWKDLVRADTVHDALRQAVSDVRQMASPSGGVDLDAITKVEVVGAGDAGEYIGPGHEMSGGAAGSDALQMVRLQLERFALAVEVSEREQERLAAALRAVIESNEELQKARDAAAAQGINVPPLKAAKDFGWQSMDTVPDPIPNDGIWLYAPSCGMSLMDHRLEDGRWMNYEGLVFEAEPTCWHPAPSPPESG